MELVANNPHRLKDIAEKVGEIVDREARDMWELGALLCEARAIADDIELSLAEGLEGNTGDKRFGHWLSNSAFFAELKEGTRKNAINLHKHFAHRREAVKGIRLSVLCEIAEPRNDDVRERLVGVHPAHVAAHNRPMYIKEMRSLVKEWRTPANQPIRTTTATTEQTEASPNLPPTGNDPMTAPIDQSTLIATGAIQWSDVADLAGIDTTGMQEALKDHSHPQYMVAARLDSHRESLCKQLAPLSKPERRNVMRHVLGIMEFEQEVFAAECNANKPKYLKAQEARLKAEVEEQKKLTKQMKRILGNGFDKKDFKYIRGVLHSDRPVEESRRNTAFDLFLKLEPLFR